MEYETYDTDNANDIYDNMNEDQKAKEKTVIYTTSQLN